MVQNNKRNLICIFQEMGSNKFKIFVEVNNCKPCLFSHRGEKEVMLIPRPPLKRHTFSCRDCAVYKQYFILIQHIISCGILENCNINYFLNLSGTSFQKLKYFEPRYRSGKEAWLLIELEICCDRKYIHFLSSTYPQYV